MPESHTNALCDTRTKMEHTSGKRRNTTRWTPGMALGITLLCVPVSGWTVESAPQGVGSEKIKEVTPDMHRRNLGGRIEYRTTPSQISNGSDVGAYHAPPILRRLCLAILSLLGCILLSIRGSSYLYDERFLLGAAYLVFSFLVAIAGMGLFVATGSPATWGWWL